MDKTQVCQSKPDMGNLRLAGRPAGLHGTPLEGHNLALIEQAKQEWEATVDSLPQFVCLLNQQGRIKRANRTVEHWGLGQVTAVRGLSLHDLFHPGCNDPTCYLTGFWSRAWDRLSQGQADECEAEDPILGRHVYFQARPISTRVSTITGAASSFGVVLVEDITERKRAEAALQQTYVELEQRVAARTSELAGVVAALKKEIRERKQAEIEKIRLFKQVEQGREQMRQLAQQTVLAQEEERQRLSHELHDEAGQALTALKMMLEMIQLELPLETEALQRRLGEAAKLADGTMAGLRSLARDLRPAALDAAGLNPTLESLCRDFAGWAQLSVDYQGVAVKTPADSADICLYRCLQEALTNVAKHAQASQVRVRLQTDDSSVTLSIADDGCGFDQARAQPPQGIGLLGIRERLELLGGSLELMSQPGRGTRLIAYLPRKRDQ